MDNKDYKGIPVYPHSIAYATEHNERSACRPVSRYLDDGHTLEVTRLCTIGEKNACSFLYGASARAAKALGYSRIITYTLDTETGISLRASGWKCVGKAGGLRWTGKRRPASDHYPAQMKLRYEKLLRKDRR